MKPQRFLNAEYSVQYIHPFVGVKLILAGLGGDGAVSWGSGSPITHVHGLPSLPSMIDTFLFIPEIKFASLHLVFR